MASCPIKSSPEWRQLVTDSGGELQAYYLYLKNNYEIPTNVIEKIHVVDISEENLAKVQGLQKLTNLREEILVNLATKIHVFKNNEEAVKSLQTLVDDFVDADIATSIGIFLTNAKGQLSALMNKIEALKDNVEALKQAKDIAAIYNLVEDIAKVYNTTNTKFIEEYEQDIAEVRNLISKVNDLYEKNSKIALAKMLGKHSTIKRYYKRVELAREFDKNNPKIGLNKKQLEERENHKIKYINTYIQENEESILKEEQDYVLQLLEVAPRDIAAVTKNLVDQRGINDHLVQLAITLLDNADSDAQDEFHIQEKDVWRKFNEFKKARQKTGFIITNQKQLYGDILEIKNGKYTGYYTQPFYSDFYELKSTFFTERKRLQNQIEKKKSLGETTLIASLKNQLEELETEFKNKVFKNPKEITNFSGNPFKPIHIKDEFHNPQFKELVKDKVLLDMYDYLVAFNRESDSIVNASSRLGMRLPSINSTLSEKMTDTEKSTKGIFSFVKNLVKEKFSLSVGDARYGDIVEVEDGSIAVMTDVNGTPLQKIAIPFRSKNDLQNQSYDLVGMALTNRYVSLNFHHKSEIQYQLEVLKELMETRKIIISKNGKEYIKSVKNFFGVTGEELSKIPHTLNGTDSNSAKVLAGILEDRLYGRSQKHKDLIGKLSADKLTDKLIEFSADTFLIANFLGATANLFNGKVMNFLEGARNRNYDMKNLANADIKYWKDIHNIIADFENPVPNSLTNILIENYLDTSMDFNPMSNEFTKDTRFKRIAQKSTLHGANRMAEHYIQGSLVYAMLDGIKCTNIKGEFVDKDGKVVSREDAVSLMDVHRLEGGSLTIDERFIPEGFTKDQVEDGTFKRVFRRKVKDITADLQGQYDVNNKAAIEREWYGKLLIFLRKWMVRGTMRRWRGIGTSTKSNEELSLEDRFYSEASQDIKEGTYTSTIRFLTSILREIKTMQGKLALIGATQTAWEKLEDFEKANIKSALTEIGLIISTFIASNLLYVAAKAGKGSDDDEFLALQAYLLRRTYGELLFYVPALNPSEALRVLRTPSATITTLETFSTTVSQLLEDLGNMEIEDYKRGPHKGESKSKVLIEKTFNPFYRNFNGRYDNIMESADFLFNLRNR